MQIHIIQPRPAFRLVLCSQDPIDRATAEFVIEETGTLRAIANGGKFFFRDDNLIRALLALN
ncbi:MAG TPA: hypothetical protein VNU68_09855 [Verrucomicrobiae bacterium]|nr:hypothetical protein [Verrucomicrobiae bacterium]